jgi:hypothetical protein
MQAVSERAGIKLDDDLLAMSSKVKRGRKWLRNVELVSQQFCILPA